MTVEQYQFGEQKVRVIDRDGESWWIARDVCAVLAIRNVGDALSSLDADEKGVANADTLGGQQEMATINESGLYSLILRSRKPEAKAFKKWVTSEVLPAIRRTGQYQPTTAEVDTALTARLAEIAHKEHVVPASGRVLAFHRWNKPQQGMAAFESVCVQLELDLRPLSAPAGAQSITGGETAPESEGGR